MPDGRTIIYTTFICSECGGGISAIDIDGNNRRVITPSGSSSGSYNDAAPSQEGFAAPHIALFRTRVGAQAALCYTAPISMQATIRNGSGERHVERRMRKCNQLPT